MVKHLISVSKMAIRQLKHILHTTNTRAIYFGLDSGGCNGFEYKIEVTNRPVSENVELVTIDDVPIQICNKSVLYVLGTKIDWEENIMGRGFTFDNPNAKNKCGCGTSFNPF